VSLCIVVNENWQENPQNYIVSLENWLDTPELNNIIFMQLGPGLGAWRIEK